MATSLVVRNVEPQLVAALKRRAARNRRSVEAEHRKILREVLAQPPRRALKDALMNMPDVSTDEDFDIRHQLNKGTRKDRYVPALPDDLARSMLAAVGHAVDLDDPIEGDVSI